MFKNITLWTLLLLGMLSGCGSQHFYFPANTGASLAYQQVRQQQAVGASTFSQADEPAGPALASLERVPIAAYQPSPESRALAKHVSGEVKNDRKAAAAPHHPVAVEARKSGQEKKQSYRQPMTANLGKTSLLMSLAGLALLLLALVIPVFVFPGFLAAMLGTVFSIIALTDITRGRRSKKDRRKAKAGFILGIMAVVLSLLISFHTYEW